MTLARQLNDYVVGTLKYDWAGHALRRCRHEFDGKVSGGLLTVGCPSILR